MSRFWLAIILISLGSFFFRFIFLVIDKKESNDENLFQKILPYIPVSVLAALISPAIFGQVTIKEISSFGTIIASLLALVIYKITKKTLPTLALGLVTLHIWQNFIFKY